MDRPEIKLLAPIKPQTKDKLQVMTPFEYSPPKPAKKDEFWRPLMYLQGALIFRGTLPKDVEAEMIKEKHLQAYVPPKPKLPDDTVETPLV